MSSTSPGLPTLRDVARRAQMSVSTASRALNGDPTVAAEFAARAKAAAAELGYVPNVAARALRGRQNVVSLLADDIGTEAVAQMATALEATSRELGSAVTVSSAGGEPQAQLAALRELQALRPRALVLTGRWLDSDEIKAEIEAELRRFTGNDGGRIVVIGPTDLPYNSIVFDDHAAGVDMGRYMASLGGTSAVILAGREEHHAFRERTRGFLEGLTEAGITDVRTLHSVVTRDAAEAVLATALAERVPDLVLAGNDRLALGAFRALENRGLRVPQDTYLSGIDDIVVAANTTPSLTTIALPFAGAGTAAARMAILPQYESAVRVHLSGTLVVRDSTRIVLRIAHSA